MDLNDHENNKASAAGEWFRCKGCSGVGAVFPDGVPGELPPGSVGHSKPSCDLYKRTSPSAYAALHDDVARMQPPDSFAPVKP